MDRKNALVENNGEVENAIDWLRKKVAKANKKASKLLPRVNWHFIK